MRMQQPATRLIFSALYLLLLLSSIQAQGKKALLIGNAAYAVGPLKNAGNDARDLAEALKGIGFEATLVQDAALEDMRDAVDAFGASLAIGDIGLFFFSGHGMQIEGRNYLIPVNMKATGSAQVKNRALICDEVLAAMQMAGNAANIVILDACRDNPFPVDTKSLKRGLSVVGIQPPDSLILYATSADQTADDGSGRNGLFTQSLLKFIAQKDSIENVINRTAQEVRSRSDGKQVPAKYSQLFKDIYLAGEPEIAAQGTLIITSGKAGSVSVNGAPTAAFRAGETRALSVPIGSWRIQADADGEIESRSGSIRAEEQLTVGLFPAAARSDPSLSSSGSAFSLPLAALTLDDLRRAMVAVPGGSLLWYDAEAEIDSYEISACEITQAQWKAVMGSNPSAFEGDRRPVEQLSFADAAEFCNRLSALQGYEPAYILKEGRVEWPSGANGYRLPTAAEWSWAASAAGTESRKFPGSNSPNEAAWYASNSLDETHPVTAKKVNALGLYDMFGNVAEWVWDLCDRETAIPSLARYKLPPEQWQSVNPRGAEQMGAARHLQMGGDWRALPEAMSFSGARTVEADKSNTTGFRVARWPAPPRLSAMKRAGELFRDELRAANERRFAEDPALARYLRDNPDLFPQGFQGGMPFYILGSSFDGGARKLTAWLDTGDGAFGWVSAHNVYEMTFDFATRRFALQPLLAKIPKSAEMPKDKLEYLCAINAVRKEYLFTDRLWSYLVSFDGKSRTLITGGKMSTIGYILDDGKLAFIDDPAGSAAAYVSFIDPNNRKAIDSFPVADWYGMRIGAEGKKVGKYDESEKGWYQYNRLWKKWEKTKEAFSPAERFPDQGELSLKVEGPILRLFDAREPEKALAMVPFPLSYAFSPRDWPRAEVLVAGGSFVPGDRAASGKGGARIALRSFYIKPTEEANTDYYRFLALRGSLASTQNPQQPARIHWTAAVEYANWLSAQDGLEPAYSFGAAGVAWNPRAKGWRIPTEYEWEYAARGGELSKGYRYSGGDSWQAVAEKFVQRPGTKGPNELGLYDMSGSENEWCWGFADGSGPELTVMPRSAQLMSRGMNSYDKPEEWTVFSRKPESYKGSVRLVRNAE